MNKLYFAYTYTCICFMLDMKCIWFALMSTNGVGKDKRWCDVMTICTRWLHLSLSLALSFFHFSSAFSTAYTHKYIWYVCMAIANLLVRVPFHSHPSYSQCYLGLCAPNEYSTSYLFSIQFKELEWNENIQSKIAPTINGHLIKVFQFAFCWVSMCKY